MTRRDVIRAVLNGQRPPYVPWSFAFTLEARQRLVEHYGTDDLDAVLQNHLLVLGSGIGFFEDLGDNRVRDVFGVVWDRTVDKDIGNVVEPQLTEPSLAGYTFTDPLSERFFAGIPAAIAAHGDRFRVFAIGFSLITTLHIVIGELAPKSLALQRPEQTAMLAAGPIHWFYLALRPAIVGLNAIGNAVVRAIGIDPASGHQLVQSAEELRLAVDASREDRKSVV